MLIIGFCASSRGESGLTLERALSPRPSLISCWQRTTSTSLHSILYSRTRLGRPFTSRGSSQATASHCISTAILGASSSSGRLLLDVRRASSTLAGRHCLPNRVYARVGTVIDLLVVTGLLKHLPLFHFLKARGAPSETATGDECAESLTEELLRFTTSVKGAESSRASREVEDGRRESIEPSDRASSFTSFQFHPLPPGHLRVVMRIFFPFHC